MDDDTRIEMVRFAKKNLREIIHHLSLMSLRMICWDVLEDPMFWEAPGGATRHHAYEGGLAVHTAEVVHFARTMAQGFGSTSLETVTVAGIIHDYGKIFSYARKEDGSFESLPWESMIGHLSWSAAWFWKAAVDKDVDQRTRDSIHHAMLAHHGRLEWRSPVEPKTLEAHILHSADMWSMQQAGNEDKKK